MNKFLRMTTLATTVAALAFSATPALAVGPSDKNATATARVVKPLTLSWQRDLDLGTIVLSGAAAWSGANVGITRGGVFSDSMIDAYLELKMQEVQRLRMTPHPAEFDMYYSS